MSIEPPHPSRLSERARDRLSREVGRISDLSSSYLDRCERRWVNNYPVLTEDRPPVVFILGPPRSGTTALFQAVTNELDVVYPTNVTAGFSQHVLCGFLVSQKLFRGSAHNCFRSRLGSTSHLRLRAPSEYPSLWPRWFPHDGPNVSDPEASEATLEHLEQTLRAVAARFARPVVLKNLATIQVFDAVTRALPDAKFIAIVRDPRRTMHSIWHARRTMGTLPDDFLGSGPANWSTILEENRDGELGLIVQQAYWAQKQLRASADRLGPAQWTTVSFEDFTQRPTATVDLLADFIGFHRRRAHARKFRLKQSRKPREIPVPVAMELDRMASALDWPDFEIARP